MTSLWLLPCLLCAAFVATGADDVPVLRPKPDCVPHEVHLALTARHDAVKVTWRTTADDCPSQVFYGSTYSRDAGVVEQLTSSGGTSHEITEDHMCSAPAKQRHFRSIMHEATMKNLVEDSEHWYRVAGDECESLFLSPRAVGAHSRFTFLALGDMGESTIKARKNPMAQATVDAMLGEFKERPFDFVMHIGDLAYADGSHKVWDSFMRMIEPLSRRVPYMIGVGNHEYDYLGSTGHDGSGVSEAYRPSWGNFGSDSGGECGAMISGRFSMPGTPKRKHPAVAPAPTANDADAPQEAPLAAPAGGTLFLKAAQYLGLHAASTPATAQGSVSASPAGQAVAAASSTISRRAGRRLGAAALTSDDSDAAGDDVAGGDRTGPNAPFWYSFDHGSVHMTVISTEHDLSTGSWQRAWLDADLADVDRCRTPWLVVALHRPMYVVYPHKDNRNVGMHIRNFIEELLVSYKVDVTIAGHVHSYCRSCAALRGECSADGVVHMVIGTGGHVLSDALDDQAPWLDQFIGDWGYGRFVVEPHRMTIEFVRSSTGEIGDRFVLTPQVNAQVECAGGRVGYSATRAVPAVLPEQVLRAAAVEAAEELREAQGSDVDHADDQELLDDLDYEGGAGYDAAE